MIPASIPLPSLHLSPATALWISFLVPEDSSCHCLAGLEYEARINIHRGAVPFVMTSTYYLCLATVEATAQMYYRERDVQQLTQ